MKKIERIPPPDCLDNNIKSSKYKKIGFYKKLKDKKENIYPRWNTTCKDKNDVSRIRKRLLKMSDSCCVYCGDKIPENMEVDHYLPSSKFPYLAYCWDNLLPTCQHCNQRKSDFTPNSLKDKKISEDIVANLFEHDYIYDKAYVLGKIAKDDRLIEPTFDDPEEHLEFNVEFYWYESKTKSGRITENMFFNKRNKKVAEKWESISLFIKELVLKDISEETIRHYINLHGNEYICLKFYEYWIKEKQAGRIYRV